MQRTGPVRSFFYHPSTGGVTGWIDLAGLNPDPEKLTYPLVLNGVAWNPESPSPAGDRQMLASHRGDRAGSPPVNLGPGGSVTRVCMSLSF